MEFFSQQQSITLILHAWNLGYSSAAMCLLITLIIQNIAKDIPTYRENGISKTLTFCS